MPTDSESTLRLRKPLERTVRDGHPWIYRDAITGTAPAGAITKVIDAQGAFLARGIADDGPIAMRVFTTRDESWSAGLLSSRIDRACSLRNRVVPADTDAYRLLHGEGDRVPGFVCDVYGRYAVLKTDGQGAAHRRDEIISVLTPFLAPRGIDTLLLRTGGRATRGDGANKSEIAFGSPPPEFVTVRERGMKLLVDLQKGQKTGLFLDQRESRAKVRAMAKGLRVMNLYGYTGGFSVAAGLGDALSTETVDVSEGAIETAVATWAANGLPAKKHTATVADVPTHLATRGKDRSRYDLIIADPPSFAPREELVAAALKSYRALHTACLALVAPGGYYLAASCSSHVGRDAFAETVLESSRRSQRGLQLLDAWGSPDDHPRLLAFPEGDYLKALLFRVE